MNFKTVRIFLISLLLFLIFEKGNSQYDSGSPSAKLEVGVHSDNQEVPSNNILVTQLRAQVIVTFLINRGISSNRLVPKGYGSTRPVASNASSVTGN